MYEKWLDDVTSEGFQRLPLPVGYDEHNSVPLHASQAFFSAPIRYEFGRGFANDWLTGWTGIQGSIWFDIDVVQAGEYAVEIGLSCPPQDAGSEKAQPSHKTEIMIWLLEGDGTSGGTQPLSDIPENCLSYSA